MAKPKFEFKLEEDRGFLIHNNYPRCQALLGDDEDLIDKVEWGDLAPDEEKEALIKDMREWYWSDFQGVE